MLSAAQKQKALNATVCCCGRPKERCGLFCAHCRHVLPAHMLSVDMYEQARERLRVRAMSIRKFGGGRAR